MSSAVAAHIALGVAATLLAALRVWSWCAVGHVLGAARMRTTPDVGTVTALLAGSALTVFVYACFAALGALGAAIAVDALIAATGIALAGRRSASGLRAAARALLPAGRAGRTGVAMLAALVWIVAIGPPRDADVLHYHLAHVRQIIADGGWRQLPICAYGPPFGWSLTFLPFVWLGLPQASHLVNTATWFLAGAVIVTASPSDGRVDHQRRTATVALWLGASLLPQSLKAATTAMADSLMVVAIAAVLAMLVRHASDKWERGELVALGFVSFVAFHSRLQTGALVAGLLLVLAVQSRRELGAGRVLPLIGGAALALVPAAPFYLANLLAFDSPFWPIAGVTGDGAVATLARECAVREFRGVPGRITGIVRLLRSPGVFPIPLVTLLAALLALVRWKGARSVTVAVFVIGYFAAWSLAQPSLTPRYAIYLLPATVLLLASWLGESTARARLTRLVGAAVLTTLAIIAARYSFDYLHLAVTGDVRRFHRATWYWDPLEWVNRNAPRDARVLVILYGGQTFHLERWNRSADVGSSAVVDWRSVRDHCALGAVLASERITHVLHHREMWRDRQEGKNIASAVASSRADRLLVPLETFDAPLVVSRMLGAVVPSRVDVYAVDTTRAHAPACAPTR